MSNHTVKQLPLRNLHETAGARFGAFAGWNMPLTYPLGVMGEHLHTRKKAGLFDISHMQIFEMVGKNVNNAIEHLCPVDTSLIQINNSKYTFLLNEMAGIIDDLVITRYGDDRFIIVSNASRASIDGALFQKAARAHGCTVTALPRVFIALQGPTAAQVLLSCDVTIDKMYFMNGRIFDNNIIITRSGYTGEDGFEISLPLETASDFVQKLLKHDDVEWIGLAARDSLRLEAGLCLYGQDLDETITPLSAGLLWAIPKSIRENGRFVGAKALKDAIQAEQGLKRIGIIAQGRQPVRNGAMITDESGKIVGKITSGGFGPSVQHPVAMALVDNSVITNNTSLFATIRESIISLTIAPLPFTPHHYVKV
jgi:aminomethyltransferase